MFLDQDGNLIATERLQLPPPWEVRESGVYAGRFYFFNRETNMTHWVLNPAVLEMFQHGAHISNAPNIPNVSVNVTNAAFAGLGGGGQLEASSSRAHGIQGTRGEDNPSLDPETRAVNSEHGLTRVGTAGHLGSSSDVLIEAGRAPLVVTGGLGRGGYGVVLRAEHERTGRPYALKVISKSRLSRIKDRSRLATEIRVLTEVSPSPFLITCHSAFETDFDIFFVLELIEGRDLFVHLAERFDATNLGFPEEQARVILAELVLAVQHLHSAGYVHRDIKVENIMFDRNGHVKLIDYGLACAITGIETPMAAVGSLIYMAPELAFLRIGGRHTDWWAVGVLAYEIMTGRSPWSSITDRELILHEIRNSMVLPPPFVSSGAKEFINSLLQKEPSRRLGSRSDEDVKNAAFFWPIDWVATASLQSAPAFVPTTTMDPGVDGTEALSTYLMGTNNHGNEANTAPAGWDAGLDTSRLQAEFRNA
eukprot:CAMPEP_0172590156 /NCGR_PEP_ID=MMETSP1068-20121228/8585_1 /TAXON_ID=35684 /ORGANISM="Pseudopedinella elastica, Strain CCMP716" /LENGTH=477 /DNA_ID=CAMNT_0013385857 /DNA_START=85 /DNA_END=1517 /DNA_ORIENTATION=-